MLLIWQITRRVWVCCVFRVWVPILMWGELVTARRGRQAGWLLRTLSALHSTSKANLPLPGDAHGLIRYLVSALMRSGLYHWGGMLSGTMRVWNTCRTLFQIMSVMRGWKHVIIIPCCAKKINHVHPMPSSMQRLFQNHEIMMQTLMLCSRFSVSLNPFVPLLSISSPPLCLLIFHPSRSISPPALPSHLYHWNYCQGTVIIEFPDLRTPAPFPLSATQHPTTMFPHVLSLSFSSKSSINVLSNTLIQSARGLQNS